MIFFFNDTATTEIYTLSLHDALPISHRYSRWTSERVGRKRQDHGRRAVRRRGRRVRQGVPHPHTHGRRGQQDRKSTRLNSSHANISYAVFCLKNKCDVELAKSQG